MSLEPGERVGPYEIVSRIGGGGMGVVYKAVDTRLGRDVALKLLSPELTGDDVAKQRFVQEAKAASLLDHPSICTLFDVGETSDGHSYLAMAYCEGESLREKVARGPLSVEQAIDYALQVASGLAEAHGAGIVHRDVKPPNIVFAKGGQVKLVDFGLAKLAGQTGPTEAGVAVGTVTYMSPEQCAGEGVDHRTDVWSLGVVLYEMLAGEPPFQGDSYFSVAIAIAQAEPVPVTGKRAGVPLELERVIKRALTKNPSERYQTVSDLAADLRGVQRDERLSEDETVARNVQSPPSPSSAKRRGRVGVAVGVLALALALVAGAVLLSNLTGTDSGPIRLTNAVQVTSSLGVEDYPAWSPDGRTLAFAANPDSDLYGGNWDIWVSEIDRGEPVNRTQDHDGDDRYPSWSPDGRQIAFWSDRDGGGYFVMSALGGTPRKVIATTGAVASDLSRPQWSRDGSELATVEYDGGDAYIRVVALESGESRRYPLPVQNNALDLSWSPDGTRMAYVDAVNLSAQVTQLGILDLESGSTVELSDGRDGVWSPHWFRGGSSLMYVSNRRGVMDVWEQRLDDDARPSEPPRSLSAGVGMIRATLSPDASQLAYSQGQRVANLWRVPVLPNRPATWEDASQLTFDQAFIEFLDVSADGERWLTSSDRNGNADIWMLSGRGNDVQQMTTGGVPEWAPRWSPDEQHIAYYGYESGNRDIYVMPSTGGSPRRLTEDPSAEFDPSWSPDGEQIAFASLQDGHQNIWVVPAGGGEPRRLTQHPSEARRPIWSPDGEWIAFASNRSGEFRLWRAPAEGGEPEPVTEGPAYYPRWSPDGSRIFFTGWADRAGNLWEVSLDTGVERAVTDLTGRRGSIGSIALATDGDFLYFTWEEDIGNIWVMDVVTDPSSF